MDFMENVKDVAESVKSVAKDTAAVVAKKTGEIVEASKVQYMMFELKNDIKKLYAEIGRLTYLALEEDEENTQEIKDLCDITAAKIAKLKVLKVGIGDDDTGSAGFEADTADDTESVE